MGNMNDSGQRITFGEGTATREPDEGKGRYDLITPFGLRRLALWYELGAKKYADRNWEKGMPFSRYLNSAKRHLDKYLMGMTDEDHLAAAAWNILAIMHHEELGQTEFDDLPHYISDEVAPVFWDDEDQAMLKDAWEEFKDSMEGLIAYVDERRNQK